MDVAAQEALQRLAEGNGRYAENRPSRRPWSPGKGPDLETPPEEPVLLAAVLACSEAETCPELVFDRTDCTLFVVRTAGPVLDDAATGSLEFAVAELGVPLLVVLGHRGCRAVSAAVTRPTATGDLGIILDAIETAVLRARHEVGLSSDEMLDRAIEDHVTATADNLQQSRIIHPYVDEGRATIIGAVLDQETGRVRWLV